LSALQSERLPRHRGRILYGGDTDAASNSGDQHAIAMTRSALRDKGIVGGGERFRTPAGPFQVSDSGTAIS
jgi:hypothetical protein